MTERERFKAAHKHLDLSETKDGWDRPIFAHSHVEAMWSGWQAALESRVLADIESVKQDYYKQGFEYGRNVGRDESRVLAERKPIYQVRPVGQLKWSDIEPVSLSMYQDAERYQTRIVFTHPTPDDAKDAARYRWLRNEHFPTADNPPLAQVAWKLGGNRHGSEWANLIDGNDLDAAIDAAMQADKETK